MKMTTDEEFRSQGSEMLNSEEPVCITHNGKPAGVYVSLESDALPKELRRALFFTIQEVRNLLPTLAAKLGLDAALLESALRVLRLSQEAGAFDGKSAAPQSAAMRRGLTSGHENRARHLRPRSREIFPEPGARAE